MQKILIAMPWLVSNLLITEIAKAQPGVPIGAYELQNQFDAKKIRSNVQMRDNGAVHWKNSAQGATKINQSGLWPWGKKKKKIENPTEQPQPKDMRVHHEHERWHDMGKVSKFGYEWYYFDGTNNPQNPKESDRFLIAFLAPNVFDARLLRHMFRDPREHVGMAAHITTRSGKSYLIYEEMHDKNLVTFSDKPTHDPQKFDLEFAIGNSRMIRREGPNGPIYNLYIDYHDKKRNLQLKGALTCHTASPSFKSPPLFKTKSGKKTLFHEWAVAMPRTEIFGQLQILRDGQVFETIQFDHGVGYHDKNWGNIPMNLSFNSWYWGRAHLANGMTLIFADVNKNGIPFNKYAPKNNFQLVLLTDRNRVLKEVYEAEFKYIFPKKAKKTNRAPNGIIFPDAIEIKTKEANPMVIKVITKNVHSAHFPYYSQYDAEVNIESSELNIKESGYIAYENMILTNFLSHLSKEAFWNPIKKAIWDK